MRDYSISFTTCSIRKVETLKVVTAYQEYRDWPRVRTEVLNRNVLQQRTKSSATRLYRELASRLKCLNQQEMELLYSESRATQELLLWIATCRRYEFIYDFAVEVLRERTISFSKDIQPYHFDTFWASKAIQDQTLNNVARSTRIKARQILFRMLRETNLINSRNEIQVLDFHPSILKIASVISVGDLRVYPIREVIFTMEAEHT